MILALITGSILGRAATDRIPLPVEIVGSAGTTASRTVTVHGQQANLVRSFRLESPKYSRSQN